MNELLTAVEEQLSEARKNMNEEQPGTASYAYWLGRETALEFVQEALIRDYNESAC